MTICEVSRKHRCRRRLYITLYLHFLFLFCKFPVLNVWKRYVDHILKYNRLTSLLLLWGELIYRETADSNGLIVLEHRCDYNRQAEAAVPRGDLFHFNFSSINPTHTQSTWSRKLVSQVESL